MSRHATMGLTRQRDASIGLLFGAFLMAATLSFFMISDGQIFPAWAGDPGVPPLGKFLEGEVTAVRPTTLDVAGRSYGTHPKLTIVDDEGHPMEWKHLRSGMIIQYSVKDGLLDRIIVLLPK